MFDRSLLADYLMFVFGPLRSVRLFSSLETHFWSLPTSHICMSPTNFVFKVENRWIQARSVSYAPYSSRRAPCCFQNYIILPYSWIYPAHFNPPAPLCPQHYPYSDPSRLRAIRRGPTNPSYTYSVMRRILLTERTVLSPTNSTKPWPRPLCHTTNTATHSSRPSNLHLH